MEDWNGKEAVDRQQAKDVELEGNDSKENCDTYPEAQSNSNIFLESEIRHASTETPGKLSWSPRGIPWCLCLLVVAWSHFS